ncbi:MAG: UDP-N-acetyl glucosamine 2-epimerase [Bacteroidales bacterium]|jgi:UDP-N-acetylglucosamine 2-epimerase (non-hydrolysing)|nr:UDP-N-acetyl glucosamine 2-epimerase [Bacteroidales bacterium]
MKTLKVLTVVGTRPEIIRLSRTIALLDQHVHHILVHTGQNYDYELNEIFFQELEIRKPDYFLNVDTSSLGAAVGDIIRKSEEVLKKEMPDAMLVLGDTNSSLAAYMAKRMHIPIFHMEAGNRSFDFNVPEEINRRIIDHIADFNLVYTEHARRHLISEGLPHRRIYLTGSPMREVLEYYKSKIDSLTPLTPRPPVPPLQLERGPGGEANDFFLVSFHREENVDNPENLKKILDNLHRLAEKYQLPVIVSTHPRTRKRLEAVGQLDSWTVGQLDKDSVGQLDGWTVGQNPSNIEHRQSNRPIAQSPNRPIVQFLPPFGFLDYINLQMHAKCVISDSGTISEESAILGFPAISLRQSMERPEAQDAGTIILTGLDPDVVLDSVELVISEFSKRPAVSGQPWNGGTVERWNGGTVEQLNSGTVERWNSGTVEPGTRNIPFEYQISDTSWRVLKLIMGNAKLSNKWWGIK